MLSANPPQLLFLPGAGADPDFWRPVGALLPSNWGKAYLGWPGLGHNAPSADVQCFEDLIDMAEKSLLALSSEKGPVDLLAQSLGGAIALALCLRHPTTVRRLVLTVTSAGLDVSKSGAADWRASYRKTYPNAAQWLYEARPDYSAHFSLVRQPTLLLWGDADPLSPVAVGESLLRALPTSKLAVLSQGTHNLARDRAAEVTKLVLEHLSSEASSS